MQHLDEGTIHAWLDGQLPTEKADEIAAHVGECPECAAMVAEARGLVAASTRILTALDNVPAGVMPVPSEELSVPIVRRRWYDRTDIRVAAALLFVAGASLVVVRERESIPSRAMMTIADKAGATAPVAVDTAPLQAFGADPQAENHSAAGTVGRPTMPLIAGQGRAPSRQKAIADALSPPTTQPAEERSPLNAPTTDRRALESRTRAEGLDKSAAAPAPTVMQAGAAIVPAPPLRAMVGGTSFAKKSIGNVEGRVTDRGSGKGLHGASVNVLGTPIGATTDTAGRFKIENVPTGAQHVAVRRIGYAAQSIPLVVDSGITVTAQVALAPSPMSLGEVVVSSPAAKVDVATAVLHVLRTDSPASATRTVYQISPGVDVTLTESPADTGATRDVGTARAVRANKAASGRLADAEKEKDLRIGITGRAAGISGGRNSQAMAVADMVSVPLKTISWTDRGRQYTLTGRLTKKELEVLKARLMAMRR